MHLGLSRSFPPLARVRRAKTTWTRRRPRRRRRLPPRSGRTRRCHLGRGWMPATTALVGNQRRTPTPRLRARPPRRLPKTLPPSALGHQVRTPHRRIKLAQVILPDDPRRSLLTRARTARGARETARRHQQRPPPRPPTGAVTVPTQTLRTTVLISTTTGSTAYWTASSIPSTRPVCGPISSGHP